jgi:DnaK suppressor protein
MQHLTETQIDELSAGLDRALHKLERSLRSSEEALRPAQLDPSAIGRLSRIDALQNQGFTRNLRDREELQLTQVRAAFERMAAGTYGICVECRAAIPFERLQVFPEAPTCTAC